MFEIIKRAALNDLISISRKYLKKSQELHNLRWNSPPWRKNCRSNDLWFVTLFLSLSFSLTHKTIILHCSAAMCALNHSRTFHSSDNRKKHYQEVLKSSDKWVTGQVLIVEARHEREGRTTLSLSFHGFMHLRIYLKKNGFFIRSSLDYFAPKMFNALVHPFGKGSQTKHKVISRPTNLPFPSCLALFLLRR